MNRLNYTVVVAGAVLPLVFSRAAVRVEIIADGSRSAQNTADGGPAVAAALGDVYWLYRGPDGTLYFDETSNVCAFSVGGAIRRFAGNGRSGVPPLAPGLANEVALGLIAGGDVDPISPIAFLNAFNHSQIVGVNLKTGRAFTAAGVPARSGPETGPADQVSTGGIMSLCVAQGSNLIESIYRTKGRPVLYGYKTSENPPASIKSSSIPRNGCEPPSFVR